MPQGLPDLRWFFFQDREEPRSIQQAVVQNLQAQWMVLCLLQAGNWGVQQQEWQALGLYILQFQRLFRALSPLMYRQLLPLIQCLDGGCCVWRDGTDAAHIAEALKGNSQGPEEWCKGYQLIIEQQLTDMLSKPSL